MTLHNIKVFCAVYEEGSMSRAAVRLNMTQPGVSKVVSDMERYYENVFFVRRNKRLYLTDAGKQLYKDSKTVLQAFSRLENNAAHSQKTRSIVLGCTSGIGFSMMTDVLLKFRRKYPDCKLYLRDSSSRRIREMVLSGTCDVAMVQHSDTDPRLHQEPFCRNELVAVCSPLYRLRSDKKILSLEDIVNEDLILLEKDRATRTLIDNLAMEHNYVLNPIWTSSSPSNVKELAAKGEGVAILFEIQVRNELQSGKLLRIPIDVSITSNFFILHRSDIWLSEEQRYLISLCREYAP
ncbi:LysR family transcriptional regulator [Treponema parvum]|uniref:LysR family transcriptional regulator n=1 Tax=Treponema parvum TaxID=138851 RepID=A0A975F0X8_9SPIR|nr:LysR family transcriptional regulator [Treponema parvum]QTQ12054.1 LysR family transcriptional regulator [Treponema parvum]QTQ15970.1 LysR family transcriptional regulator [Treponema parvum]